MNRSAVTRDLPLETCQIITGLDTGGAETQLSVLMERRHAAGHRDLVVSLLPGGALAARLRAAGVPVSDLAMTPGRPSLSALSALTGLIRRARPQVVQSWLYHADLMATTALFLSGRWFKTSLFWNLRCSDMDAARYRRLTRMGAMLSRYPEAVIANAQSGRAAHQARGFRPRRWVVIPNGIDTHRFRPNPAAREKVRSDFGLSDDRIVLAHVARTDPMKDHALLIDVLDRLETECAFAIGAGTEALPEHPRLLRLGPRTDVPDLLAAADIMLSTSAYGEGFSNALAEGMACGLPAVATDVGDAAIIVGDHGRIVPPRNPVAFAEAVRAVIRTGPARIGREGRARIRTMFGVDPMVTAYNELYRANA